MARNKKALAAVNGGASILTVDALISGGDNRISSVVVPGITMDGQPATVFHLPLTAEDVLQFMEDDDAPLKEGESQVSRNAARIRRIVSLLSSKLTDPSGNRLATEEQLLQAPASVLTSILNAITDSVRGNASSEADGDTSSTASQPS